MMVQLYVLYFMFFLIILIVLYVLYKVRKIHLMMYGFEGLSVACIDNLFNQIQAYIGLINGLDIKHQMPFTRGWAASPDFLQGIATYAIDVKPDKVVECSCGVSTLVLARCMQINGAGHVYSLENSEIYAQKTRENISRHGLESWATVIYTPLKEQTLNDNTFTWYDLDGINFDQIDMLVVDGPPDGTCPLARYPAVPLLYDKLSDKYAIYLDDASRADEKQIVSMWLSQFKNTTFEYRNYEKGCAIIYGNKVVEKFNIGSVSKII